MFVTKRDGTKQPYDASKITNAIAAAINSAGMQWTPKDITRNLQLFDGISVEAIQNLVECWLMKNDYYEAAKAFIIYREKHKESRFIRERLDYMEKYSSPETNAASASETDANSNVTMKNVANLEGEVYKTTNRIIQRQRMKDKLNKMFPEVADQYEQDINHHIIYIHDEASTPVLKYYCCAVTLYPLMVDGVGNIDGVTPSPPNDIQSFSGQVTNLAFLLSSQCKGAVAFGDYFIALNYYVIKEFGENWVEKLNDCVTNDAYGCKTIKYYIRKGMKQFIYGVNQPAGNRSYNSPFTNLSYYDSKYFQSLFEDFYYPDGTKPKWTDIDNLQRIFMELHRELRLIKPLTFPVTTMALVHDKKEFLDLEYKQLCAEEWAKGGSFFCYNSDNPSSLASCCRVLNEVSENTFSSTTGMTGIMTGSCNVITLNINRIVQDWFDCEDEIYFSETGQHLDRLSYSNPSSLKAYLSNILERVYKYHIAFKTMLYEQEDKGMFAASNGGYIYMNKLYSTIGVIGYCEAAQFLGCDISNNPKYIEFLQLILGTIKEQNKVHSIRDKKRPFLFNSEAIPGEGLAVKYYNWDKENGYLVPENQNLYNSYFYSPWDNTSVLTKITLHGKQINTFTDGGQATHLNLDSHLSTDQYIKLLDFAKDQGNNYFTFNIPMTECTCGHVVNAPVTVCPKCGSKKLRYWTRIIGYLTCTDSWSSDRQKEFTKRVYTHEV